MKHLTYYLSIILFILLVLSPIISIAQNNPGARYGHTLINYNGKIYLFGGANNSSPLRKTNDQKKITIELNDLWRYNEDNGTWEADESSNPPPVRKNHTANVWNGKMVIYGGKSGTKTYNDLWTYDFTSNVWSQLIVGGTPPAVSNHSAVIDGDFLVIAGGADSSDVSENSVQTISLNNPEQGFQKKADLTEPLQGGGMYLYNSSYYFVGGIWDDWDASTPGSQPSYSSNTWCLNPNSSSWSLVTNSGAKSEIANYAGVFLPDSKEYYVIGGSEYDYINNKPVEVNSIKKIDVATQSISPVNLNLDVDITLPIDLGATAVKDSGEVFNSRKFKSTLNSSATNYKIYIYGGIKTDGTVSSGFYKFNPSTNKIEKIVVKSTPIAPSNLKVTSTTAYQVALNWQDNSDNELGFIIEKKEGSSGSFLTADSSAANINIYEDKNLKPNTDYYYRISAYNQVGKSIYSNEIKATTYDIVPIAPSGLVVSSKSDNQIDLIWKDESNNEVGFKLERKSGQNPYMEIVTLNQNIISYSDSNLEDGTNYFYRVTSYNTIGKSEYSNEGNAITQLKSPSNLQVKKNLQGGTQLDWEDASKNESGFKIEKKINGGIFNNFAEVPSNIITYNDNSVTVGQNIIYRVYAYNPLINSSYSNEAEIVITDIDKQDELPTEYSLRQNYPNPFNPSTMINYDITDNVFVTLIVYDLLGREVTTLINGLQSPGRYSVIFNSGDANIPSGTYFYRINAGKYVEVKKMLLIK